MIAKMTAVAISPDDVKHCLGPFYGSLVVVVVMAVLTGVGN